LPGKAVLKEIMGNNISKSEYDLIKTMLSKNNPTVVHRRLSHKNYRGITTVRQINKSKSWKDYTKTYWKQTEPKPVYATTSIPTAWYYNPYSPPGMQVAKKESFWSKIRKLF